MANIVGAGSYDYTSAQVKQKVLIKTNIGGWFFDAVFKSEHTSQLKITDHPVQTGASLTDYAYLQPETLIMDIGMTDVAQSIIYGQFTGKSRSVSAFQILQELQAQRIPLQVTTRLKVYQNMLIETIVSPDDYKTSSALKATVTLREIQFANVQTVKISAKPNSTNTTNRGTVEPVKPNQTVLKQAAIKFTGKK